MSKSLEPLKFIHLLRSLGNRAKTIEKNVNFRREFKLLISKARIDLMWVNNDKLAKHFSKVGDFMFYSSTRALLQYKKKLAVLKLLKKFWLENFDDFFLMFEIQEIVL